MRNWANVEPECGTVWHLIISLGLCLNEEEEDGDGRHQPFEPGDLRDWKDES